MSHFQKDAEHMVRKNKTLPRVATKDGLKFRVRWHAKVAESGEVTAVPWVSPHDVEPSLSWKLDAELPNLGVDEKIVGRLKEGIMPFLHDDWQTVVETDNAPFNRSRMGYISRVMKWRKKYAALLLSEV
jgi:hypothetical protein